jgi:ABC-2 type transport system permease protein
MKLFWSFTRQAFHNTVIFRFEFWMRLVWVYLTMYGIFWVWRTLFAQRPGAFNVTFEQMVTYGLLGMALDLIMDVDTEWYISNQARTGAIDTDLMKPLDFHLYMLARSTGEMLFSLGSLGVPAFLIGYFFFHLQLPSSLVAGLLFAFSLVLGFWLIFHLGFLLGLVSLLTFDIRHISWAYYSSIAFLAGQLIPLWLFPGPLRALAEVLPFKGIYYVPISIYIGTFSGASALEAIGFQLAWSVGLALFARWAWGRVQTRLIVQGG